MSDRGRIRVKQFLWDYGTPACGMPSLYGHASTPFECANEIGWLGTDYGNRRAAAALIDRTTLEIAVLEGAFRDEDLRTVLLCLEPVDASAQSQILQTSRADLIFQARHDAALGSNYALFKCDHSAAGLPLTSFRPADVPTELPGPQFVSATIPNSTLNAVFVVGTIEEPKEIHYVYEQTEPIWSYFWVFVSAGGMEYPIQAGEHPCEMNRLEVNGRDVHHAFVTQDFGPHEAVWDADGYRVMLLTKATPATSSVWFQDMLRMFV